MSQTTSLVRPVLGKPGSFERIKVKPISGDILGWGEFEITQPGRKGICSVRVAGESGLKKLATDILGMTFKCGCGEFHLKARNKVTGLGLRHIVTAVMGTATTNLGQGFGIRTNVTALTAMRVGTGTGATTDGTTSLVSEVATNPSSITLTGSNPTGGTYRMNVTATWNAGTISAVTVTEVAIKGNLSTVVTTDFSPTGAGSLFARVSTTDGEITAGGFLIDVTFPLVLSYNFNQVFA